MNKVKVAIIDSGINKKDKVWKGIKIKELSICNGNIGFCEDSRNLHGNNVAKIIYFEYKNIELISIQVLNSENKGSINDLIYAIQLCICMRVNVINLSLGTISDGKYLTQLNEVCELAANRNIVIFASNSNQINSVSYPACFKSVISVGYSDKINDLCNVDVKNSNIYFKRDYVSIPNNVIQIEKGTSFICPKFVGLFCALLSNNKVKNAFTFLKYIKHLCENKIFNRMYIDKSKKNDDDFIEKQLIYIKHGHEDNELIEYYKNVCKEVIVSILCEVDFNINNNLYFVGTFSAEEIIENRKRLDKIISESIKCHKSIISILPLDTIINRICLINDYGIISKSFYI